MLESSTKFNFIPQKRFNSAAKLKKNYNQIKEYLIMILKLTIEIAETSAIKLFIRIYCNFYNLFNFLCSE